MSETTHVRRQAPPPKLVVSRPADDIASTRPPPSRRRSKTESSLAQPKGRSTAHEWIDIDDPLPQLRKRASKRKGHRHDRTGRSSLKGPLTSSSDAPTEGRRYRPQLGQIQEGRESNVTSRPSTRDSDEPRPSERGGARRRRHRDDISLVNRRLTKHRVGALSKRTETVLQFNPSLLSVLSSLTRASDRSSSSSNTVTQRSYNRSSRAAFDSRTDLASSINPSILSSSRSSEIMDRQCVDDGRDDRSVLSSSSSHYEPSDAGSTELPSTPSSHSTYPSPTTTRAGSLNGSLHGGSVAELRRRYDVKHAPSPTSNGSVRSSSHSPESSARGKRRQPTVNEIPEDEDDVIAEPLAATEARHHTDPRPSSRSSSVSSRDSHRSVDRMQHQVHELRQHMAHNSQPEHHVDPVYGQHRSHSSSSAHSAASYPPAYAPQLAMQQYQYPPSPAPIAHPIPLHPANGHLLHAERPPMVPDAPDLSRKTIVGYEKLAMELASHESSVKPAYRKFEYLNHRILLHLQDELCEMEEQLRLLDEIAAQMESAVSPDAQQPAPASRRRDTVAGSDIHHQRIALLGRIFQKTEQYNHAMTAYNAMLKDCSPAAHAHIAVYRDWLRESAPVHESEARFLDAEMDLVVPGQPPSPSPSSVAAAAAEPRATSSTSSASSRHAALTLIPVALMLPLLLFSIIPTLAGRLAVTTLLAVGAFMVAGTTRVRHLLPPREWAVCGATYILLMAAVAGCIPSHAS